MTDHHMTRDRPGDNVGASATGTFLVYGAAGARGSAVAYRLLERGVAVRVLGHAAHPGAEAVLEDLRNRGAEVVPGDLDDPASLAAASRQVRKIFLHPPLAGRPDLAVGQMQAALDAARDAGVERVVLATNMALPERDCGVAGVEVNREVERLVAGSGVTSVVLRPTLYLGNIMAPWSLPRVLERGELAYPLPIDLPVSWLAPEDGAEAAVLALLTEVQDGLTLTVSGPKPVRGDDLAAAVAAASGRQVQYVHVTPQQYGASVAPVVGEQAAAGVTALYEYLSRHGAGLLDVSSQPVADALGLHSRDVRQWAREQHWG